MRGRAVKLIALWINYAPPLTAHRRTFRPSIARDAQKRMGKKERMLKMQKFSTSDCSRISYGLSFDEGRGEVEKILGGPTLQSP